MSVQSKFYFKIDNNWVYQGITSGTTWDVSSLELQYSTAYEWKVDTYDTATELTTSGDTWDFTIETPAPPIDPVRPAEFSEDNVWGRNPETGDYEWLGMGTDIAAAGGGRYRKQLIVVGHQTIYFGDL
jgi:hypothetical protein